MSAIEISAQLGRLAVCLLTFNMALVVLALSRRTQGRGIRALNDRDESIPVEWAET